MRVGAMHGCRWQPPSMLPSHRTQRLQNQGRPGCRTQGCWRFLCRRHRGQGASCPQFGEVCPEQNKTGLYATGDAALHKSCCDVVGIDEIQVFASSESDAVEADYTAGNPGGDLEIALMLDVTGSMCNDGNGPCTSGTKISALKDAAKKLVDTVVWDDQSKYTSRIAIVPSPRASASGRMAAALRPWPP